MKEQLTKNDVTPAVKSAVRAYLLARTHAEVMREAVDAIEREVLAECPLSNGLEIEHGQPARQITEPREVYNCTNRDELDDYYATVNERALAADIKPATMPADHCPALVAERIQTEAEWIIEDAAADMMDLDFDGRELNSRLLCMGLDTRKQFIDLIVGLVVNLPDYKAPALAATA